jgi:hypothetical protein
VKRQQRHIEFERRAPLEQPAALGRQDAVAGLAERQGHLGQFAPGARIRQVVASLRERLADQPFAARANIDREGNEALLVDCLKRLQPGDHADIMLGRAPAEEHRDTGFILARHPVPQSSEAMKTGKLGLHQQHACFEMHPSGAPRHEVSKWWH